MLSLPAPSLPIPARQHEKCFWTPGMWHGGVLSLFAHVEIPMGCSRSVCMCLGHGVPPAPSFALTKVPLLSLKGQVVLISPTWSLK